jgi:hypothetical protein
VTEVVEADPLARALEVARGLAAGRGGPHPNPLAQGEGAGHGPTGSPEL